MRSARCSLWRWNLNQSRLAECRPPCLDLGGCWGKITPGIRAALAKACATKATPWFKNVSAMERIGREIVGPVYRDCDEGFQEIVDGLFAWIDNA